MGTSEDFARDLEWREALLRIYEREPELCAAVAELAEEFGLHEHGDDIRSRIEAQKRATSTKRDRDVIARFGEALIEAQTEVARELRGEPDRTLLAKPPPRYSIPEDTPPEQA
jgi:hypothetical protein